MMNHSFNPMLDLPTSPLSDNFMMFEFKVRKCNRSRPHDWTDCPYAHPGEKARRRNPKLYNYSATPCPEFKKGNCCSLGDSCEFSHGVFECWLHPSRYRTQLCKDGAACVRPVCFFAHSADQLRFVETQSCKKAIQSCKNAELVEFYDGSPARKLAMESNLYTSLVSSPALEMYDGSPARKLGIDSNVYASLESPTMLTERKRALMDEIVASLRQLELRKVKSMPSSRSFGSAGFVGGGEEGMERVESGRALRAKLFEKLSRENGVGVEVPDFAWISELVK